MNAKPQTLTQTELEQLVQKVLNTLHPLQQYINMTLPSYGFNPTMYYITEVFTSFLNLSYCRTHGSVHVNPLFMCLYVSFLLE